MGWGKKFSHAVHKVTGGISKSAGSVASTLTGNKSVGKEIAKATDKVVNYAAWPTSAAHGLAHLATSAEKMLNPQTPEVNVSTPEMEMPDYSEYMAQMADYIAAMNAAMNRAEPAAEPLKQAQAEMSEARADTDRKQLLRRGLMSTYTRYGTNGGVQRLGA